MAPPEELKLEMAIFPVNEEESTLRTPALKTAPPDAAVVDEIAELPVKLLETKESSPPSL